MKRTEQWEEEFDKFITSRGSCDGYYVQINYNKLKDFIRQERKELLESIVNEIGKIIRLSENMLVNNEGKKIYLRGLQDAITIVEKHLTAQH